MIGALALLALAAAPEPAALVFVRARDAALVGDDFGSTELLPDPDAKHTELKAELRQLFATPFMRAEAERIRAVRKLAWPGIGEAQASEVLVLVHDPELDALGAGPVVVVTKGSPVRFRGRDVGWILVLSDGPFGSPEDLFREHNLRARVPELVLAHELMHGMTADLLSEETYRASMQRRFAHGHGSERVTEITTAYWEGLAEAMETLAGDALPDALSPSQFDLKGPLAFLVGRQRPVRENAYALCDGRACSAEELMRTEGFVASFTYRLFSELHLDFMDLARVIHDAQPINSVELARALSRDPRFGPQFVRVFLPMSSFVTYAPAAYMLRSRLEFAAREENAAREQPQKLAAARAMRISLEEKWTAQSAAWLREAEQPGHPDIVRLAPLHL